MFSVQLKNFIQDAKFDPKIDDNYFARSKENTKSDDDYILSIPTANYIIIFQFVGLFLTFAIIVVLLIIFYNTKRWDLTLTKLRPVGKANKYGQGKIFSAAFTALIVNLYTIALDGCTIYTVYTQDVYHIEVRGVLSVLPITMIAVDGISIILCIALCSVCIFYKKGEHAYVFLAISTLGPTISVVNHLPYILIAYLNDALYATSIFVYYTVIVFILFGVLDLSKSLCMGAIIDKTNRENRRETSPSSTTPLLKTKTDKDNLYPMFQRFSVREMIVIFAIAIPVFMMLIVVLMGMVTALVVVIPISGSIGDAPNRSASIR